MQVFTLSKGSSLGQKSQKRKGTSREGGSSGSVVGCMKIWITNVDVYTHEKGDELQTRIQEATPHIIALQEKRPIVLNVIGKYDLMYN